MTLWDNFQNHSSSVDATALVRATTFIPKFISKDQIVDKQEIYCQFVQILTTAELSKRAD